MVEWQTRLTQNQVSERKCEFDSRLGHNTVCYTICMICKWNHCNNELSGKQRSFCSINCKNKYYVTENRRKVKRKLVEHFGGKCVLCGYDKSYSALQFHHVNKDKSFGIAASGLTRSYKDLLNEAEKCILICANCHAEQHGNQ